MNPTPDQMQSIKSILLSDLKPVKPVSSPRVLLVTLIGLLGAILLLGSGHVGIAGWEALAPVSKAAIFAPAALGLYLLALSVVRQMVPGSGNMLAPALWAGGAFVLLVTAVVFAYDRSEETEFFGVGLGCLGVGAIYSAVAGLSVWLVVRRGALLSSLLAFAVGGGMAGFAAAAALELRCPNPNLIHILCWHLALVPAGVFGGLAAMKRRA